MRSMSARAAGRPSARACPTMPHIQPCNAPAGGFFARKGSPLVNVCLDARSQGRPDLSVIVVTHQGRDLALRILRTGQAAAGPIDVEWLVVDSGSTDGTPDAIERELPGVAVIRRPNIGFAAANNVGLRVARGRYMLLLNPDLEIVEGTLAQLVAEMDQRPGVGITSSITHYPDGRAADCRSAACPSPARQLGEALMLTRLPGCCAPAGGRVGARTAMASSSPPTGSPAASCSARREAVEQAGGMDERFFLFSEETDWCRRVRTAGWDIRHLPTLRLTHHTGRTERPDLFAQNSYSKVLYARKHFGPLARGTFRAALALRHAVRWLGLALLALRRPELHERVAAERLALLVVLGLEAPRYRPYAERAGS